MGNVGCDIWEKWVGGRKKTNTSISARSRHACGFASHKSALAVPGVSRTMLSLFSS